MSTLAASSAVVSLSAVSKRFAGVQALSNVALTVEGGEVRALVGANGSGKSTLVKILAGYHQPEPGANISIRGMQATFADLSRAQHKLGIGVVHQDLGLINELTALENFLIPQIAASTRLYVDWSSLRKEARPFLKRFGVEDVNKRVTELPRVTRAQLALARAVKVVETSDGAENGHEATGLLALDEITAFMSLEEIRVLHDVVREVARSGHAVLFISHDLDEVMSFADSVTVLRDGVVVGKTRVSDTSPSQLFELIVGRKRENPVVAAPTSMSTREHILIEKVGIGGGGQSTFEVAPGEVLGLSGLLGSGFEAIPYALFGARSDGVGLIRIGDRQLQIAQLRPSGAIADGIVLVPGDRLASGVIASLSIAENVAMLQLDRFVDRAILAWRKLTSYVRDVIGRYRIVARSPADNILTLSGGNQQRVLLAKWLEMKSRLLLLHEPVRGVDVAARAAISQLLRTQAGAGTAVICASGDYEFLSQTCDRVLIYKDGAVVDELRRSSQEVEIPKEQIEWSCLNRGSTTVVIGQAAEP